MMSVVFFFFQAEDGIRDHCVTGVQTCALPIWISKMNEPLLTSSLQSLILSKGDLSRKPDFHWTCQSEAKGSKPCNAKHVHNTWVKLSNKIFQSILPRGFSDWHMIDHKSFKSLWKHTVKVAAPSNQKQPLRGGIICHVIAHYL